jgi:hypothetical protein
MIRGVAIPTKRIIHESERRRASRAPRPRAAATLEGSTEQTPGVGSGLSARPAEAADLPWLQTWAAHLGLPAPRSRRVRSFILLKDAQRVGYLAMREELIDTERGREPIMWIVSAFLIPSLRGRGLILKFGEILSEQVYPKGKVGFRVAADNLRMLKLVARPGWKKLHSTRRFTDFMLQLDAPFPGLGHGLAKYQDGSTGSPQA